MVLPPQIDGGDLLALMAQLPADHQAHLPIQSFLLRGQRPGGGAAGRRGRPAGQFPVAGLGVGMAQPVEAGQTGVGGVPFVEA